MFPCGEHSNHLSRNLPFGEKHLESIAPEDGFQLFQFKGRSNTKHAAFAIKTVIRYKDVAVWVESKKIAEGLKRNDGARDGFIFWNHRLEKDLQGFPGAAGEIGKKLPVVKKISAENLFSLTLTVGLTPQLLPAIISINWLTALKKWLSKKSF
jgi:hypothetical protein